MCKQNNFQNFLLFAIEMAVLSVFSQKKGLGPSGVKALRHDFKLFSTLGHILLDAIFLDFL